MHKVSNTNLSNLTTLRIGGNAEHLFYPDTPEELIGLVLELQDREIPWSILGGGSNLLVSSKGVRGAVICTSALNWIKRISPDTITVGAGLKMPKLAGQMSQWGLSGTEFMEGIPGTVGGATIMNAGAHGQTTSNILEKVTLFDTHKAQVSTLTSSHFHFGYRTSSIDPSRYIVLEAKFRLNGNCLPEQVQDKIKQYRRQRATTQPKGFSSGCIFRNPPNYLPAGKLIDEAGLKGCRLGGVEVSMLHANFIMNAAGASSGQACSLIQRIQNKIWQSHQIWLQPEVWGMGEFEEEEKIIWLHPEKRAELLVG